ncbi:MAG: sterol desaturase family protein [Ruegeria sp.]
MNELINFVLKSGSAVVTTAQGLFYPALFFLFFGLLIKRNAFFEDIRRAIPETRLNIHIIIANIVLVLPIIAFLSTLVSDFWTATGLVLFQPADWDALPVPVTIFLAVLIGDFVGYWRHRFEHNSFLWPSHAVHHSDTEMTWLTLERFHPINRLTTFVIDSSALLILGLPPFAVFANYLVRHYYGFFIHADIPWTYGKLNYLFVSPVMHRWHHSADKVAHNRNFATVFGLWDWMFGTRYMPGICDSALGVTDDVGTTVWSQLSYAFKPKAYRHLFRRKTPTALNNANAETPFGYQSNQANH